MLNFVLILLANSKHIQEINRNATRILIIIAIHSADLRFVAMYQNLRMVDSRLFNSIQSPSRCLSHLLPPEK